MNEKLTVRNFGPIKEAEVEFKRVTVFIGPTGGGKSTLAKLAAIFRDSSNSFLLGRKDKVKTTEFLKKSEFYDLAGHFEPSTILNWRSRIRASHHHEGWHEVIYTQEWIEERPQNFTLGRLREDRLKGDDDWLDDGRYVDTETDEAYEDDDETAALINFRKSNPPVRYTPAERVFVATFVESLAGLALIETPLPRTLLDFGNRFAVARKTVSEFDVPFFNVTYRFVDGQDKVEVTTGSGQKRLIRLAESASGLQSSIPLLLVIASRRKREKERSFIVEEPELNLFPTAQRPLINELVGKCTQGKDDLILTTHSPYILSHLNLLLYAFQVANQYPERADEVARIVPRESWINSRAFSAYYVGEGSVRSIVDIDSGLIDSNALDEIAGDQADAFDNLIRLTKRVSPS